MASICGKSYIIDSVVAEIRRQQEREAFKTYVTDCLNYITSNTAKLSGGVYIKKRYTDIVNPPPVDDRPAMEIAKDVLSKAGIKIIQSGGEKV